MAKGALRTFFREDAGYPEEQPDLTDFLLDSMIQGGGPRMGSVPMLTTAGRGQQGAPGPQNPTMPPMGGKDPWGMPMPGAPRPAPPPAPMSQYPSMPGPMQAPQPMPQMAQPRWIDYLAQAGGGLADGLNARGGYRSNFFGQIGAQQQGLRDRDFQAAMAERGAMENAARLAHEYDWRKYGAGMQEKRFDQQTADKAAERALYDKMIGKRAEDEQKQSDFQKFMFEQAAAAKLKDAGGLGDLDELGQGAMLQARTPEELAAIQRMIAQRRGSLESAAKQQADAAALEKEIEALTQDMVTQRMGGGPGEGWEGVYQAMRPKAEAIVRQRRGIK